MKKNYTNDKTGSGNRAIDTAASETLNPSRTLQSSTTTIGVRVEAAPETIQRVICCGTVRCLKDTGSRIHPQVHARIFTHKDPILTVTIDGVVRDIRLRNPCDTDSILCIATDRVPNDAGVRRACHEDPMSAVVLNGVRTSYCVATTENPNEGIRATNHINPVSRVVLYRVVDDYS